MKSKFNISTMVLFFAICIITLGSSCKKEKELSIYTKDNWEHFPTNPFVDSASQIPTGSANFYVMFKGTENQCEKGWQDNTGRLGRFFDSGKYAYGNSEISVTKQTEEDCKQIMKDENREYLVFAKPLNPYSKYTYDSSYKNEPSDTLDLKNWTRIK